MTESTNRVVLEGRREVEQILMAQDDRLIVIVGPCSIHDEVSAMEYARKLATLRKELSDRMLILMRVYFEKPRTTVGWKGLINDPDLDGSFDIETGLLRARKILSDICELGLPAASEILDPITPQYLADFIVWASIGARTTESQTHRQMASGLSMPVGFKNATDGNLQIAVDAMKSSRSAHSFLGLDAEGRTCVVHTKGNNQGHLILRGGRSGPNYHSESVHEAGQILVQSDLPPRMIVDCSHANSLKNYQNQPKVWRDVMDQRLSGNSNLIGMMLESHLHPGNQSLTKDPQDLKYGISITDACLGWEETEALLRSTHSQLTSTPHSSEPVGSPA